MQLVEHGDVREFLASAGTLLAADEARHNLMYGICSTLTETPSAYPDARFWTVEDAAAVAALLRTPPYNVAIARPAREGALAFAADSLRAEVDAPGVTGAVPEVEEFAHAWSERPRVRMRQGVYAAREIRPPERVRGEMRLATIDDLDLVVTLTNDVLEEALPEDGPAVDIPAIVSRRLRSTTGGVAFWEADGEIVSMCGFGGATPHGIRIGPVYTPPKLRGNGYGSAITAAASKRLLDAGRDFCFLYTDLANPTSNKIYMQIGYEFVCNSADYAFDPV